MRTTQVPAVGGSYVTATAYGKLVFREEMLWMRLADHSYQGKVLSNNL